MGYAADYFDARVGGWIASGWLPRPGKIADFGAQEFDGDQTDAKRITRQFLRAQGVPEARIEEVCASPGPLNIGKVYRAIGIDYVALDLEQVRDVHLFDLSCFAPPLEWRMMFDLVNNEGAIEHLTNPINGFQVAHELLKVGGVAVHSIPLTGHSDHGLMQPTLKFYDRLVGVNGYDLLQSEISIGHSQPDFAVRHFALRDQRGRPLGRSVDMVDAWLHLAYRKAVPGEFRAPFSRWNGDDTGELGERAAENAKVFSRRRLTERGRQDGVASDFELQLELQRREQAYRTWLEDRSHENRRKLQVYDHQHDDQLTSDVQQKEHQHDDQLTNDIQQKEHAHEDKLTNHVQKNEHEHEDKLTNHVQKNEHEHEDKLTNDVQKKEHAHADMSRRAGELRTGTNEIAGYLPLFAIGVATLLNAAALLIGLFHEWSVASWFFGAGLVSGFLPTAATRRAWTSDSGRNGKRARNASRILWLLSVVLFAIGCAVAGSR